MAEMSFNIHRSSFIIHHSSFMLIGVLAIQGDFGAHRKALARLGVGAIEVRRKSDLENLDGLIIPGGESTTMLKLIEEEDMAAPIKEFARSGKPIFGTCAGAILLARDVNNPQQPSLNLIDISIERNAFGRQVDSFIAEIETTLEGGPVEAVFIRAPRIRRVGPEVSVLARFDDEPAFVREGNILAATFHPELTNDARAHRFFVELVNQQQAESTKE
jgi:5'-phosphate synthase pdxT subunit